MIVESMVNSFFATFVTISQAMDLGCVNRLK